jgi:hypothetical protein
VKRCTTRFRGNALDVVASDVTSIRRPVCGTSERSGRGRMIMQSAARWVETQNYGMPN